MKLEIIQKNDIEFIEMFRVGYFSKKEQKIKFTPFFTTKEKAIEHYTKMCLTGLYENDTKYFLSKDKLF